MKITIPTTWKDVTLRQYQELAEVPQLKFDYLDSELKKLEILTGVSDNYFFKVHLNTVKKLIAKVDFINHKPTGYKRPMAVRIDGRRFHVNYIPQELVAGEYIDLMERTKTEADINKNIHKIISIYLKPVNLFGLPLMKCYKKVEGKLVQTDESIKWTQERVLDHLTMDKVFPMSGFFLTLWESLIESSQSYSEEKMKKLMKEAEKEVRDLTSNGDGL